MKVHKPPMHTHGVNERDASSDQISRHACPIVLEGVDADAVKKLHPSK